MHHGWEEARIEANISEWNTIPREDLASLFLTTSLLPIPPPPSKKTEKNPQENPKNQMKKTYLFENNLNRNMTNRVYFFSIYSCLYQTIYGINNSPAWLNWYQFTSYNGIHLPLWPDNILIVTCSSGFFFRNWRFSDF